MDYKKYRYHILCEDRAHYNFARGWLIAKNVNKRNIYCFCDFPITGDAKQHIAAKYALAKEKIRKSTVKSCLVVIQDADNKSVEETARKYPCSDAENVFLVIPKWSIETWFIFLEDRNDPHWQNESMPLKNQNQRFDPTKLGAALARTLNPTLPMPESLAYTIKLIKAKKQGL